MADLPDRGDPGSAGRMLRMDQVHIVRHKVLVEGRTQRSVARELIDIVWTFNWESTAGPLVQNTVRLGQL